MALKVVVMVVMSVAGCGKSTLARLLSRDLGCEAIEGDDFHSPASQRKMQQGIALDDADREPWLDTLGRTLAAGAQDLVVSCSALKRSYRERLRADVPDLKFVFIEIDPARAAQRVAARSGHLFPPSLVRSQFLALEPPRGEAGTLTVPSTDAPQAQADATLAWLCERSRRAAVGWSLT